MNENKPRRGRPPKIRTELAAFGVPLAAPVAETPEAFAPVQAAEPASGTTPLPAPILPVIEAASSIAAEPEPEVAQSVTEPALAAEPEPVPATVGPDIEPIAAPVEQVAEAAREVLETVAAETPSPAAPPARSAATIPLSEALPVAAIPAPAMKGIFDMATVFESAKPVTEKAQAMFGDINERAKSAMEKSQKLGEEMTEFTKGNVEAIVASGRIAAKGAETLAQEAADYGKKSLESATTAFKSFSTVKSPTELFQLQSEFAKTSFDSAVAEASKMSEAWIKIAGDVFQPLSSRAALAAEKIKSTSL